MRSDVENSSQGYAELQKIIRDKHIPVKYMIRGEHITIGQVALSLLWPSAEQIAKNDYAIAPQNQQSVKVLGATVGDLNDYSLVFWLRFGAFDALFTGDADTRVEGNYVGSVLADREVELLKVPHHGSRTGINQAFVQWLRPKIAVISVGKNTYGHPSQEALQLLESVGSQIHRTDKEGDIEVMTDGNKWIVK